MYLRHLGYACQNLTLGTVSRTIRLANLRTEKLIPVLTQNFQAILDMLRWNEEHDLYFLRVSSDLVPFGPLPEFPFEWAEAYGWLLDDIRRTVKKGGHRVTSHPGQYTVLNSPREEVVQNSIDELEHQAHVIELMDPKQSTMTLHVGGAYGDKPAAMEAFARNLDRLSDRARARLIIENDDKTFTLAETVALAERTGLPVVVDLFHHKCNPGEGCTWEDGLPELMERAVGTWGGRVPKLHLSSQKPGTTTSHADYLTMDDVDELVGLMESVGGDAPYDLMLEAKKKEQAVLEVKRYLATGERPNRAGPMEGDPPIELETPAEAEAPAHAA